MFIVHICSVLPESQNHTNSEILQYLWDILNILLIIYYDKQNAKLQRADPGTKVPGLYFPTQWPKWIFIIPIVLVEKKHHKLIYHVTWLHQ